GVGVDDLPATVVERGGGDDLAVHRPPVVRSPPGQPERARPGGRKGRRAQRARLGRRGSGEAASLAGLHLSGIDARSAPLEAFVQMSANSLLSSCSSSGSGFERSLITRRSPTKRRDT